MIAKMTSAYANKMIRKLNEDKDFWRTREQEGYLYVVALGEEPVVPAYDYAEVAAKIAEIDDKVIKIKHAINVSNATNRIQIGDEEMTVDAVLVKMAQLSQRKMVLDSMRKQQPKTRIGTSGFVGGKNVPEYQYINYDLELIKGEYERVDTEIADMQIALDRYNQTVEFEVEV